jgi:hypothetical protein
MVNGGTEFGNCMHGVTVLGVFFSIPAFSSVCVLVYRFGRLWRQTFAYLEFWSQGIVERYRFSVNDKQAYFVSDRSGLFLSLDP